jgi:hypothetical protein
LNYLLDANTYIQAKNEYYQMEVCPGYWDWLDHQFAAENLASVSMVYDELKAFGDELSDWVKERRVQFLDVSDEATQSHFSEIAEHVVQLENLKPGNRENFLEGADPWLIAKAREIKAVVVTHEALAPESSRKVKVPNVCKVFDVECINTFQLLRRLEARFILERQ